MHPHDMIGMEHNPKRRIKNKLFHPLLEMKVRNHIIMKGSRMDESQLMQVNKVLRMDINLGLQSSNTFVAFVAHFHLLLSSQRPYLVLVGLSYSVFLNLSLKISKNLLGILNFSVVKCMHHTFHTPYPRGTIISMHMMFVHSQLLRSYSNCFQQVRAFLYCW